MFDAFSMCYRHVVDVGAIDRKDSKMRIKD